MKANKLETIEEIFGNQKEFSLGEIYKRKESSFRITAPLLFIDNSFVIQDSSYEIIPKKGILEKEDSKKFIIKIWDLLSKEGYKFQKSCVRELGAHGTEIPLYYHSNSKDQNCLIGNPLDGGFREKSWTYYLQRVIGNLQPEIKLKSNIYLPNHSIEINQQVTKNLLLEELELKLYYK